MKQNSTTKLADKAAWFFSLPEATKAKYLSLYCDSNTTIDSCGDSDVETIYDAVHKEIYSKNDYVGVKFTNPSDGFIRRIDYQDVGELYSYLYYTTIKDGIKQDRITTIYKFNKHITDGTWVIVPDNSEVLPVHKCQWCDSNKDNELGICTKCHRFNSVHKSIKVEEKPKEPYFKGKGEHSVNELEKICEQYKELVHYFNSKK